MKLIKPSILFGVGGFIYVLIELIFRQKSHWTMLVVGGLCFLLIGWLNEGIGWETPFILQMIAGGLMITFVEFISGCIVNIMLGWDVWNYSDIPSNVLGQICLPFSLLWCIISAVGIVLDDWLRYLIFDEEKPHYKLL